jgi:hypothetical protein
MASKYLFIVDRQNKGSSSDFNHLTFVNTPNRTYKITFYREYQYKKRVTHGCIGIIDETGRNIINDPVKYDIEFDDLFDEYGEEKRIGLTTIDGSQLPFQLYQNKKIIKLYKFVGAFFGGHFAIFDDTTAVFLQYGSGIHFQTVMFGKLVKQTKNN